VDTISKCPLREHGPHSSACPDGHQRTLTVEAQGGKKIRFLRSIPIDPMTKSKEWGLRSMQDDPDSDSWGGQSVFDVYTKSEGTGLDGTKYKD
jgi:hypothetical protein